MKANTKLQVDLDLIDVIVLSPSNFFRQAITNILEKDNSIRAVREASNKLELLDHLYELNSSIVVIHDREISNFTTAEAVRIVNEEGQNARSILLIDDYDKEKELRVLEMGVRGYLPETKISADLAKAIKAINSSEMWVRREVMGEFVQQIFVKIKSGDYLSPSLNYFNKREMQVMVLLNKNLKNKEIAKKLHISESTVKHYVSRIFKKLDIDKRGDIKKFI